ncbi:hypothetical protein OG317_36835 [Streptomyces sp. NBC_01167]|uniref:hypothetical protein n=1 Tax=Streptomyces sp. NBC_01167 TaxID=2903756 RepID=UPI00386F4F47|nr:hypothetical protein OG317_36835 [Streptomyces sp. NBC_01167]
MHAQLLSATAQLSILLGNMCADDQADAFAQQYHRTAAHLAAAANDQATYSIALRVMATHAGNRGHHGPALLLARQAAGTAQRHAPDVSQAFVQAQLAIAEAQADNQNAALSALRAAEVLYAQADQTPGPFTSYPAAGLYYQRARALAVLGDNDGVISALSASLRARGAGPRRNRALTHARLAEALHRQGFREAAQHHWRSFLYDYAVLRSAAATQRLTVMRQLLHPYRTHAPVARLLAQAAHLS